MKSTYLFILVSTWIIPAFGFSQDLKRQVLTKQDSKKGVLFRYRYNSMESHFAVSEIIIYKNGKFKYELTSSSYYTLSYGAWVIKGDLLIFKSTLDTQNLPFKVYYINSFRNKENSSFKFRIVKNKKDELLNDALIYVNNDSTECLPVTETCIGRYDSIDSVKVVFENGYSSKWLNIKRDNLNEIQLILQMNINPTLFTPFNRRYRMAGNVLKKID